MKNDKGSNRIRNKKGSEKAMRGGRGGREGIFGGGSKEVKKGFLEKKKNGGKIQSWQVLKEKEKG